MDSYTLFEEEESPGSAEAYHGRSRSHSSSVAGSSFMSDRQSDGVIDGRYSFTDIDPEFVSVDVSIHLQFKQQVDVHIL